MTTEVWFRNCNAYIRELAEENVTNIVWDRGLLVKKNIDPKKHADLYLSGKPYRVLLTGEQGTCEIRPDSSFDAPTAVYPTWKYGDDLYMLEEIMASPVGENEETCDMPGLKPDERPVFGQEHRVVIIGLPDAASGPGRQIFSMLKTLQEDYPDCILHIHGVYSFNMIFGLGFRAGDIESRNTAAMGKVMLPVGKEIKWEASVMHEHWITALGMTPISLKDPRNRCIYNIRAAIWAGEHFTEQENSLRTRAPKGIVPRLADRNSGQRALPNGVEVQPGDKVHCDTCSLTQVCRSYRPESVCTLDKSDTKSLAVLFQTRNADTILDGIAAILVKQTERTEAAVQQEEELGVHNPEVTKMLKNLYNDSIKYVKLVDPARFSSTMKLELPPPPGQAGVINPRELVAGFVKELEARGVPRENITNDLISAFLAGQADPNVVESAAVVIQNGV